MTHFLLFNCKIQQKMNIFLAVENFHALQAELGRKVIQWSMEYSKENVGESSSILNPLFVLVYEVKSQKTLYFRMIEKILQLYMIKKNFTNALNFLVLFHRSWMI